MAKDETKTFSDEDIKKVMEKADSVLQKIGDRAKNLAFKGKKKKEELKIELDIPKKRVMIASVAAVALLTPISVTSILGAGAVGAIYVGINKLIKDSIKREYADVIKNSQDSQFWKLFSETKNEEIMNSLASAPEFVESNMQALARNKNATAEILTKIHNKALTSPDAKEKTLEGSNKIKEALLANENTPENVKKSILESDNFRENSVGKVAPTEIEVVVPGPEEGTVIKSVLSKDENNQTSELSSSVQPAG